MFVVQALCEFSKEIIEKNGNKNEEIKYLKFAKDDKILTKQVFENGWNFGCVIGDGINPDQAEEGFFPSNYVKHLEQKPPALPPKPDEKEIDQIASSTDWLTYAENLIKEEEQKNIMQKIKNVKKETFEEHFNALNKESNFDKHAPSLEFGMKGFKKIKIDEHNKKMVLKDPEAQYEEGNEFAYIPVLEQDVVSRAYRQMGQYFDYDQWNDQVNEKGGIKKSKPDPSRKKGKNEKKKERLNFLTRVSEKDDI